ncbi:MAG TPA: extracellular solute-binding protein [Chitinophagaceae bacterium]|nr:extracellular solute-binding protein [Chitinophagaceae bacterium]
MSTIVLKGITWGHSRGFTPLMAFSQRFSEMYPQVEVVWKKRSLQEFADYPLEKLTGHYDLLIIDHPWVGCAAAKECVLALDLFLPTEYLQNQQRNSVGISHLSYSYDGHQWALAIDAAAPAASYRADLFPKHESNIPSNWNELMELAKRGKAAAPAIPIDLLMNFYMFCIAHGKEPFGNEEEVIDEETGLQALDTMKEFYSLLDKKMFSCNPIAIAELMTTTDDYWYCPFAYCYSNYSREGYSKNILHYTDLVNFKDRELKSTIGGTGIAVSASSQHKEWAVKFAEEIVSETCQSTFYVQHSGQPGHRAAWTSKEANVLCNNFFSNLLPVMDRAYMRPRYDGYLNFQDVAGEPLHKFLEQGGKPGDVLNTMNHLYRESLHQAILVK